MRLRLRLRIRLRSRLGFFLSRIQRIGRWNDTITTHDKSVCTKASDATDEVDGGEVCETLREG